MIQALRQYQTDLYTATRNALMSNRAVCVQLATGAGKTPVASAMIESVFGKNKRAWYITPRRELINQASEHLSKWGVDHHRIDAKNAELLSYRIHVVSKETLSRRWDKIKNWPDLIIVDESHLNLDFQLELYKNAPATTFFIGMTATPERLDGRGLSKQGGGIYDTLIQGPAIPWLMDNDYLTPIQYYAPPLDGIYDLKFRGTEIDEESFEELMKRRKVYGEVVGHYEQYGKGKPALGFCRSVKAAYDMAERFRDKGYNFHCVEGKMPEKKLRALIDALRDGAIDGLTTCDLVLYGVDIPRIEYGFSVRPTLSFALYMQMLGRLLRPFRDDKTGYVKQSALFFDHVNMIQQHGIKTESGVILPPHYVDKIDWNFDGIEKRKKQKSEIKQCPYKDFQWCDKQSCAGCKDHPDLTVRAEKPVVLIPAELKEIKRVSLADMDYTQRRETEDRIGAAVLDYKISQSSEAVRELLRIADACGYSVYWVYHRLNENEHAVNTPVLAAICREKGFKPGWIWMASQKIKARSA